MPYLPILSLSRVRGLIRRRPSLSFYVVPALVSHSDQQKEANFEGKTSELNETQVLRVLGTMKDDPYLALSFLKRIEGNGALPSLQAYATVITILCSWGLDMKLVPLFVELIRKGDDRRGFSVMDLLKVVRQGSLLLLRRVSSALVRAFANLEMFEEAIHVFFLTYPNVKALNFLMNRMLACGKTDAVVAVFGEVELDVDADAYTYVLMLQALYRNNDGEGVEKFLKRLLNLEMRNSRVFYMSFIEELCVNRMADTAHLLLEPLRGLVDNSDLGNVYRKVVHSLCNERKVDDAERVLVEMENCGIDPDVYDYSVIIEGHRRNMKFTKALDVFNKIVERDLRLNCVIISSVLQCYRQMGKFSEAYDWFKEFKDMNISLDRVCYNAAFDALGKLGKVEEAIELFREMKGKGIAPDVINYTTLMRGCFRQGKIPEAFHLMIEMKGTGVTPDIVMYNVLAGGLARNGLVEDAIGTLELMKRSGVNPTCVTHNMVIEGLIVAGRADKALAFYKRLEHKSPENDASIVKGYCEAGHLDQAFERFVRLELPPPKNVCFTLFTNLCAENDYIGKAQELVERMWELGVEPEKSMYGKLIGAWCRVYNVGKARQFCEVLVGKGIVPDLFTYTIMISTYCRLNKLKQAYSLFKDMKKIGIKPDVVTYTVLLSNIPKLDMKYIDVKPDVVYYTVLIDWQCKIQDVRKAKMIFSHMIESGVEPDVVAYTSLIDGCCKRGNLEEAKRIFNLMIESGIKPDLISYTALIVGCCRNGSVNKAVTLMQDMSKKGIEPTIVSLFVVHYANLKGPRDYLISTMIQDSLKSLYLKGQVRLS